METKIQKVRNFKKAWNFDDVMKASAFRDKLEDLTDRLWAIILLDEFYVLPHRLAIQNFKSNIV